MWPDDLTLSPRRGVRGCRQWQEDESPEEPQGLELILEPDKMAGVWANWAQVSHTEHEFTIDFVRRDAIQPNRGIVVARVALSPLFVTQLTDALQKNWARYAAKALPKEVRDAEEDSGREDEDEEDGSEDQGA